MKLIQLCLLALALGAFPQAAVANHLDTKACKACCNAGKDEKKCDECCKDKGKECGKDCCKEKKKKT